MALPLPVIPPQPDAYHLAPHRMKRCTFPRRLIDVQAGSDRVYDGSACSRTGKSDTRWATFESAMPICNSCVAPHIFRADED